MNGSAAVGTVVRLFRRGRARFAVLRDDELGRTVVLDRSVLPPGVFGDVHLGRKIRFIAVETRQGAWRATNAELIPVERRTANVGEAS